MLGSGDCFEFLLFNKKYSDVVLVVRDNGNKACFEYHAHRAILASRSQVFDAMFSSPMKESEGIVHIQDTDHETLKLFLEFVYLDRVSDEEKLDNLSDSELIQLIALADQFQVLDLLSYLLRRQDKWSDITLAIANLCVLSNDEEKNEILENCLDFIDIRTESICKLITIDMSKEVILYLLKYKSYNENEYLIFESCLNWCKEMISEQSIELETSDEAVLLKEEMKPFNELIRFELIESDIILDSVFLLDVVDGHILLEALRRRRRMKSLIKKLEEFDICANTESEVIRPRARVRYTHRSRGLSVFSLSSHLYPIL